MNPEQVQRDLNEVYRGWVRRYQAAFFGSRSRIAEIASTVSSLAASSDFKRPSAAEAEEGAESRLPKAA
jgi:hypothetical protein